MAASTSPQVSSAAAYEGVSECRFEETMTPRRVQASMSMCGYTLRWLMSLSWSQPIEQRRADLRPLADQHQRFGILQALGKRIDILHVVVPDLDFVAVELAETLERAQRVMVVVENRDLHVMSS